MSIKTPKRLVLGLIASLVLAPFAAVAPASADDATNAEIGSITASTPGTGRVGNPLLSTLTIAAASGQSIADNDDLRLRALMLSKPAASTAVVSFSAANTSASFDTHVVTAAGAATNELMPARMTFKANTAITNDAKAAGSVGLIPDVVGDYEVRVWNDTDNDGLRDSDEDYVDIEFTVGNPVASVSVTAVSGASIAAIGSAGGDGALVKLTLLDSAGAVAGLAGNESITLTGPSTMTFPKVNNIADASNDGYADATGGVATLQAAAFVSGVAYVNMKNTAAATTTITISSTGVTPAISGTFTQVYRAQVLPNTALVGTSTLVTSSTSTTAAAYGSTSTIGVAGTSADVDIPVGSKTLNYYISITGGITDDAAAAQTLYVENTVTDVTGFTTGSSTIEVTGLTYDRAVTLSKAAGSATAATGRFTLTTTGAATTTARTHHITSTVPAIASQPSVAVDSIATTAGTPTITPSGAITLQTGSKITYTASVVDNFGRVLPNASVQLTGGTRNAIVTPRTVVTNASGEAAFEITDAPAAGVTSLTDTFTFTVSFAGSTGTANSGAITWSATAPAVSTVTLETPTKDDTASVITYSDINAGSTGAQATLVTLTATVKDASGNLLAGIPVTFSTASAGAAVLSTHVTRYTGADGTATTSVYGWTAGTKTYTATAGGKSGTGTVNYKQQTATEARTVSAALVGKLATVTVKDRFGNTVEGVNILGTRTGTGYFGTGSTTATGTTDKNGEASFVVEGVGTFTFSATTTLGVADPLFGQTCAAANKVSCAATAADITASVAGTATVAETGVGASFAAAGVNSATVTTTAPVPPVVEVVYDKPTLSVAQSAGRVILSGTAVEGEGDIIIYVKRIGTTAWKERAKTLEVAAPGDFNGSIRAPKGNVVIRVKQEGTGLFSNQVIVLK